MTLYDDITGLVKRVTCDALHAAKESGELVFEEMPAFLVEEPRDKNFGDFSVNAAMLLVKQAKRAPRDIAQIIVSNMNTNGTEIQHVSVAGPGFINFQLDPIYVTKILRTIEMEKDRFG